MITVIFEVHLHEHAKKQYLDIAGQLRPLLEKIDGFISVERFQSLQNPEKLLSLSTWTNEEAVSQWRNTMEHQQAQHKGNSELCLDYRIRVTQVLKDYNLHDRKNSPSA